MLGPHSETLSDLQLELLADEEPRTTEVGRLGGEGAMNFGEF